MDILQFTNDASTTIAAPINTLATSVTLLTGTGTEFPTPSAGFSFFGIFTDAATKSVVEIVRVTAKVGDTLTIVRGQDGTAPQSWIAGDLFYCGPTAATMQAFSQIPQTQASAYNVGVDTGSVNSIVAAFTPPITTRINGLTLRIKVANNNNGPSTVNVGAGSAPLVNPDGSPLGAGAAIANGWIEIVDDTVNYQLISSSQQAQSLAGAATTGAFQWRPTSETLTGWVVANQSTIGNASSNATQRANVDTANLFAWHWNNFSNTQCQVFTSGGSPTTRGANAAADFAANKSIQVYDKRGKGVIGVDTMGAGATARLSGVPVTTGNATTPGSVIGENFHTLNLAETPGGIASGGTGTVTTTATGGRSNIAVTDGTIFQGQAAPQGGNLFPEISSGSWGSVASMSGTATVSSVSNNTGGGSHNTVELVDTGYWWIKL